jgi:hypothetical protein
MSCVHHTAAFVCDRCPERYDTDGRGFVHRTLLAGRTPLRQCEICGECKPPAEWSRGYWFRCAKCGPQTAGPGDVQLPPLRP